ncbi:enoyl-CoA hydratase-related protein [Aeromicrobium sp. UC242_57]|uniref:enoyl-CoA hydratase-related protein n=1 Tax=Aeromicrobium sp. UC242_57 TaxID=3374624 RepID=UPI0037A4E1B1
MIGHISSIVRLGVFIKLYTAQSPSELHHHQENRMSPVISTVEAGVAHVRLNRPDKRNAIDDETFDLLATALESCRDDSELLAVVLSGEGASFCAGMDFSMHTSFADEADEGERPFADPDSPESEGKRVPGRGQRIVRAMRDSPVPVIVAVHGHAIGAGLQLALGADIRIAAPNALLGQREIDFGLTVDMGASQLLPRLVGPDRAFDLITTGRLVTGTEAMTIGLVTRLDDDPIEASLQVARNIAERNPHAIKESKRLVRLAETASVTDGMHEEPPVMSSNIGSSLQVEATRRYFAARAR